MAMPDSQQRAARSPFQFTLETTPQGPLALPAAVSELVAQMQVRCHGLNPYLRCSGDSDQIQNYLACESESLHQASCFHEGELLAWARWGRMGSPGGWAHGEGNPVCLVDHFVVRPGKYEKGACSRILEHLEEHARQKGATDLYVPLTIAHGQLEAVLERRGYRASDVQALRPPLQLIRPSKPIPEGITVRHARPGEEDRLLVLILEEWAFLTSFNPSLRSTWSPETGGPLLRQNLAQALAKNMDESEVMILVAEENRELIGVAYLRLVEVEDAPNMMPAGVHVVLEDIAVRADSRGRGIGRAMIQDSFETFRKRSISAFSVSYVAENPIARRIWPHLGFRTYQRGFVKSL